MSTLKSIIVNDVPTTMTAVYTNATAAPAALKALNVSHTSQSADYDAVTGTYDGWSYFGGMQARASSSYQIGVPKVIKLSANRMLLATSTYGENAVGGAPVYSRATNTVVDLQVVDFDGTKFRCGPAYAVTFPASVSGRTSIVGAAVSSSLVAFYVQGALCTIDVNGPYLGALRTLDTSMDGFTTTTTENAFSILPMVGDATKVVLVAANTALTTVIAQAYGVSTTAAPTKIGTAHDLAIGSGNGHSKADRFNLTTNDFLAVGLSSGSQVNMRSFSFNTSTNVFTNGATTSASSGGSVTSSGLLVKCLSTGAGDAVVVQTYDQNQSATVARMQTSKTVLSTTATLPISTSYSSVTDVYDIGLGRCVVAYGTRMDWLSLTSRSDVNSSSAIGTAKWCLPFDSRPLVAGFGNASAALFFTPSSNNASAFGGFGTVGTYCPIGRPRPELIAYSETAGCYITAQAGKMYALSAAGAVLYETDVVAAASILSSVSLVPDGRLVFVGHPYGHTSPALGSNADASSNSYYLSNAPFTVAAGATFTSYTHTVDLPVGSHVFVGGDGATKIAIWGFTGNSSTWSAAFQNGNLTGTLTANSSNSTIYASADVVGMAAQMAAIMSSPPTSTSIWGTWNLAYPSFQTDSWLLVSNWSPSVGMPAGVSLGTGTNSSPRRKAFSEAGYGRMVASYPSGTGSVIAYFNGTSLTTVTVAEQYSIGHVAYNAGSMTVCPLDGAQTIKSRTFIGNSTTPIEVTGSSTSASPLTLGAGYSISVGGVGINQVYTSYGQQTSSLMMKVSDGTNEFWVTPVNGSSVLAGQATRNNDTYYLPPGYSVRMMQTIPKQLDAMLSVLEDA